MENTIQHKAFKTQIDKNTEGKVSAFVSVYGNVDSANEICDYGCFAESLQNKYPVMCLYHNWEMPIGKVTLAEEIPAGDDRLPEELKNYGGLYIEAQLNLDKQIAREAWSDIKMGVLTEYSIGYVVLKDSIDNDGYRHLTKVDLIECSPVVRAANPMTKTLEVKSVKIADARTSVIVDIDGTLLNDNNEGIQKNVDYVNKLYEEYHIDIVTGRRDTQRASTENQLQAAGVKYNALHMNDFPEGAPVIEFKKYKAEKLLEEFNGVHEAIENDSDVRDMYESLGINAISPGDIPETADKAQKEPYVPNEGMKEEAARALKWKEEGLRGGTRIGLTRANQIVNGENLSEETVKRMYSYFSRHEVDKQGEGFDRGEDGYPSPGRVAWGLWGGDAGYSWSKNIIEQLQREEEQKEDTSQINTKQMKEFLDQIQEMLAAVMQPLDELKTQMAAEGILDADMEQLFNALAEPLQSTMGPLDELRVVLAEMGYLDATTAPADTAPASTQQADDNAEAEVKALDLPVVLETLSEIMSIAESIIGFEIQVSDAQMKSVDDIATQIASLMTVVQQEIDAPTGEVDLQAMVDAFTIVNTNVDELIAEAQVVDPEANPDVADYIANLEQIKVLATGLMETVMAEMEASTQTASAEEDGAKAVAPRISYEEQIELEQLFSRVLQSQFNITQ